jgi:AraC family transcriptional regulator
MTGIEVASFEDIPRVLTRLTITGQLYAQFSHHGHVTQIRRMWQSVFEDWLPGSGYDVVEAPDIEHYGDAFNPLTGEGQLDIWIPVRRRG